MEGLIYCARNSFNDQFVTFEEEPPLLVSSKKTASKDQPRLEKVFETIEIRRSIVGRPSRDAPEQPSVNSHSQKSASELCAFYLEQDFGEIVPQLKLIHIQSRPSTRPAGSSRKFSPDITKSPFDRLLNRLKSSPWVLWLISSKYDGFHHIKAQNEYADTYFFGFFHSAIIWTFLPTTACTKVLLISRRSTR